MSQVQAPGQKLVVSQKAKGLFAIMMFIGALTFVFGLVKTPERIWPAFLLSFWFFFSLSLGGLFFTAIQHVAAAGWSVTIRRFSEAMTAFLPVAAGLAVVLLVGAKNLYPWLHEEIIARDWLLQHKEAYLNFPFFIGRVIAFFALWILFSHFIVGNSTKQDKSGDPQLTRKTVPIAVGFVLFFAISYSLFSVDALMSLQPHWFSTIFGVYTFAGLFQSTIAVLILITLWMMRKNLTGGMVNENHLHDLGKFLKAFTVFYAYIAFSQFMLIWYANIPEETEFYIHRAHHGWMAISMSLIFFKFIVPFIALLPKWAKRTPGHLGAIAVLLIVMQMVDNYWLIYPNFNDGAVVFGWSEIGVFLGILGLFLFSVTKFLSRFSLIPVKDPRLKESVDHVVTY